ncbi:hypothetical protein ACSL103130_10895 [Actinomyces slackii]|uniref:Uncharacterized protein n=1 Tax=Actinomyces slackii TaxID=52774 RepID=A0A448KFJ6_9ACTO|nr:hypothetical protein [Actinomyces slackii]VEG75689.1 Uncharacterised protein [Actinomyces slackii]
MSESPAGPAPDEPLVDQGSWARFTPSLERLLDGQGQSSGSGAQEVVLIAPLPVIDAQDLPRARGLGDLLRRRAALPSPEAPRVVLAVRAIGVEVRLPGHDDQGRALLGRAQRSALQALGWQGAESLTRTDPDPLHAAEAVTRVLIEVLRVAHPADLECRAVPMAHGAQAARPSA